MLLQSMCNDVDEAWHFAPDASALRGRRDDIEKRRAAAARPVRT